MSTRMHEDSMKIHLRPGPNSVSVTKINKRRTHTHKKQNFTLFFLHLHTFRFSAPHRGYLRVKQLKIAH
jgi:hypothetical protein